MLLVAVITQLATEKERRSNVVKAAAVAMGCMLLMRQLLLLVWKNFLLQVSLARR